MSGRICIHPECGKIASFAILDFTPEKICELQLEDPTQKWKLTKPTHCFTHKDPKAIDVVTRKCENPFCFKNTRYGFTKALRCGFHKDPGMKDCLSILCDHEGCSTRPSYSRPGDTAIRCKRHADDDMVNTVSKKCTVCNSTTASYGITVATHCKNCSKPNMINFSTKQMCDIQFCTKRASYGIDKPTRCTRHKTLNMNNFSSYKRAKK